MVAPTFVSYGASVFNVNTTPKSITPTVQVGDIIVVFGLTGNDLTQINTPSDGVNTYASPQNIQVTDFVFGKVWTATATTAATLTISATRAGTGGDHWGLGWFIHRGSGGIGTSNKANTTGAPSVSLTTSANSAVIAFLGDWNATATTGKTWRTVNGITPSSGNGLEKLATLDSGIYTVYAAVWNDTGTAGANTYGMTAPTGQKYSIIAIEVLGSSTSDVTVADTPSGVRSGQSPATVAVDVLVSDTPSGMRAGQSPLTVAVGVNVADTPSGARAGGSPTSVVFAAVASDTPSGTRLASSPATVAVDVRVSDSPTGARCGSSPVAGVTIDSGVADVPGGIRLGQSPATVTLDTVVADSPSGLRLGQSSAVVGTAVQVQDVPNGARLGSSPSTVAFDVRVADLPGGLRLAASSTTVTSSVVTSDTSSGMRQGLSPATVATGGVSNVTIADRPQGIRLGSSTVVVTASSPVTDTPTIFADIGETLIVAKARPFVFDAAVGVNVHAIVGEAFVTAVVEGP